MSKEEQQEVIGDGSMVDAEYGKCVAEVLGIPRNEVQANSIKQNQIIFIEE